MTTKRNNDKRNKMIPFADHCIPQCVTFLKVVYDLQLQLLHFTSFENGNSVSYLGTGVKVIDDTVE